MFLYILSLVLGLVVLVWSADKFVDGASGIASLYGMPPLLIGMVVIGFGTSAPEMVVSALASYQGNSGIALGNAYGSNITNIDLILGVTSMLMPIAVNSQVLRKELPILTLVNLISIALMPLFYLECFHYSWGGQFGQGLKIVKMLSLKKWKLNLKKVKSNPLKSYISI